jgi:hypothetical protein
LLKLLAVLPTDTVKRNRILDRDNDIYEQLYYATEVDRATPRYDQSANCNGDLVPFGSVYVVGSGDLGNGRQGETMFAFNR